MKKRLSNLPWRFLTAALLAVGLAATTSAADHEHVLKVGKKAGVTLDADTQVGDQTLEAGRYQVQHRTDGELHFVKFIRLDGKQRIETDVKCRMEPKTDKIDQTSLTINNAGPTPRVTRIAIRGETASHWLTPASH